MQWKFLLLLLGLYFLVLDVRGLVNWRPALDPTVAGTLGVVLAEPGPGNRQRIDGMETWSPLTTAGARVGDIVLFDHLGDSQSNLGPGTPNRTLGTADSIGVTITDGDQSTHVWIKPVRSRNFLPSEALLTWICGWAERLITLAVGLLIAVRRSESRPMRWLALSLMVESGYGAYFLPSGPTLNFMVEGGYALCDWARSIGLLYFILNLPEERPPSRHLWVRGGFYSFIGLRVFASLYFMPAFASQLAHLWAAGPAVAARIDQALDWLFPLTILITLWISWRHGAGAAKQRLAWIALAVGISMAGTIFFAVLFAFNLSMSHSFNVIDTLNFLSALALGYAVLRYRVFDFGFVVNRAIVFAIVSSLLLVIFALAEWAVDRVLHFEGREKSAIVDAAIALVLITGFHRIQHWVSNRVNQTLFRHWQEAADRLRAFVARAPFITEPAALQEKLLSAIEDFAGIQGSALYLRGSEAGYQLQRGTLAQVPTTVDENNDIVLEMRRTRAAVDLGEHRRTLSGEYALPMMARGLVNGFVVIGSKAEGQSLRSDELALLAKSVHDVGLDLESLRIELLERSNAELSLTQTTLRLEIAELRLAARHAVP
jgi:hypothetical protein